MRCSCKPVRPANIDCIERGCFHRSFKMISDHSHSLIFVYMRFYREAVLFEDVGGDQIWARTRAQESMNFNSLGCSRIHQRWKSGYADAAPDSRDPFGISRQAKAFSERTNDVA